MINYFVHETAIIDEPSSIGSETKIWHFCHLMKDCIVGKGCIIGQNVFISNGVQIGNGVKIQNNVSIYTGVKCEDNVFIGPSVVFTNVINPRSFIERKDQFKDTIVEQGCSIGANATIICGNRLGKYSMIGAGSVVTKNVNNFEIVAGNPAKHLGWISKSGSKLNFFNNKAVCNISKQKYILKNNKVSIDE